MKRNLIVAFSFTFFFFDLAVAQEKITLEKVITLALEKNYDVQIAGTIAEVAKTNKDYAFGAFLPVIAGTGSSTWNSNQQHVRFADPTKNSQGLAQSKSTNGTVQMNWLLFDGTRMFATRERLGVAEEQGQLLLKNQMTNTIASVITSYYDIVRQKQQLRALREQMSVGEERVKLAERKLEVGTGIKPELLQAKVDYNAQRTLAIQQQSVIAQLKQQLNGLVALQLPAEYDVADTIVIDMNIQPEELNENIDNTNYSLMAARSGIHIANLALRERRAEYLPFISATGAYNSSKTNFTHLVNVYNAIYSTNTGFNYGLSVSVPVLNGFNQRRLVQQAKIEVGRQTQLYNQLKTNVNVGLKNAYVNYDNAKRILSVQEENIGVAKENVYVALEGFKRGATTFIELRTAQQSLADANYSLILARFNAKVAETELLRLSGKLLQ